MGALYHIVFFRPINPIAAVFGILFIAEGALFALAAARGPLSFGPPRGWSGIVGALLIAYALAVYPVIGSAAGHGYPRAPLFGVAPCPTTIFTFGILLWARTRVPVSLLIIPFLWGLVGFSAARSFGITEDFGLLAAALVGTGFLVGRSRVTAASSDAQKTAVKARISPTWWPLMLVASPLLALFLIAKNRRFRKDKAEAERSNRRRIDAAGRLELPELKFVEVTVLVEGKAEPGFLDDAGVSYLFRTDRGSLLFDVGFGPTRPALGHNAKRLGITLTAADALAVSHLHVDHMGGIPAMRARTVVPGPELGSGGGRKCYLPAAATADGFDCEVVEGPRLLSAGIATTGPLARSIFFMGLTEEQALVARLKGRGLVVFTGCGHPGIGPILEMVRRISDDRIYAFGGGLHFPITDSRISRAGIRLQMILGTGKPPWRKVRDCDLDEAIEALNGVGPSKVYLSPHDSCDHALARLARGLEAGTIVLKAGATYRID